MQIKPLFDSFEEVSRTPLLKDDRDIQYSLVHFKGKIVSKAKTSFRDHLSNGEVHETFYPSESWNETKEVEGYRVLSDQLRTFSNGATAYDDTLFWSKPKELTKFVINDLNIIERFTGTNSFWEGATMNTEFFVVCEPLSNARPFVEKLRGYGRIGARGGNGA